MCQVFKLPAFLKSTYFSRHRRSSLGAGGRGARRRVRGTLHPTHHMLHTQRYTHNSAKYTLDTYTLHTKHYTLNTTKCTLNTTHSTLHTTHSPGTATAPLELFVAARADACGVCGGRNASCTGYEPLHSQPLKWVRGAQRSSLFGLNGLLRPGVFPLQS